MERQQTTGQQPPRQDGAAFMNESKRAADTDQPGASQNRRRGMARMFERPLRTADFPVGLVVVILVIIALIILAFTVF